MNVSFCEAAVSLWEAREKGVDSHKKSTIGRIGQRRSRHGSAVQKADRQSLQIWEGQFRDRTTVNDIQRFSGSLETQQRFSQGEVSEAGSLGRRVLRVLAGSRLRGAAAANSMIRPMDASKAVTVWTKDAASTYIAFKAAAVGISMGRGGVQSRRCVQSSGIWMGRFGLGGKR